MTGPLGVRYEGLHAQNLSSRPTARTFHVKCCLSAHFFFFLAGQKNWNLWNRTVYTGSDKKD